MPEVLFHTLSLSDYARMVEGGILLDDTESFDQLMEQCVDIEAKVNASMS